MKIKSNFYLSHSGCTCCLARRARGRSQGAQLGNEMQARSFDVANFSAAEMSPQSTRGSPEQRETRPLSPGSKPQLDIAGAHQWWLFGDVSFHHGPCFGVGASVGFLGSCLIPGSAAAGQFFKPRCLHDAHAERKSTPQVQSHDSGPVKASWFC